MADRRHHQRELEDEADDSVVAAAAATGGAAASSSTDYSSYIQPETGADFTLAGTRHDDFPPKSLAPDFSAIAASSANDR